MRTLSPGASSATWLALSQPRTMGRTVAGKAMLKADPIISGSPSYPAGDGLPLLDGLRVISIALNLPGPAACARLRELGASVAKVEPPSGDPFEEFCPAWYRRLHEGMEVGRLDLKSEIGR